MKNIKKHKIDTDKLSLSMFVLSLCILMFLYGYASHQFKIFPYSFLAEAAKQANLFLSSTLNPWFYRKTTHTQKLPTYEKHKAYNGLTLVTSIASDYSLVVSVIDMNGKLVHQWDTDWFRIWPDATHISQSDRPKSQPGTHIHGTILLENGDLIFNFEYLGLVRLDICGNVVWRFPHSTHHSIYRDEYDNLWVSGRIAHQEPLSGFPNYIPPFFEPMVFKVSLDGEMLNQISILRLLKNNDLRGLLFLSNIENDLTPYVSGDIFHLNDIETFPSSMEEGIFEAGDIMVSLRNSSTILVFDEKDLKIKQVVIGEFTRQHDPDFIDGNTISIFDNNNYAPDGYGHHSRILIRSFLDHQLQVYYTGDKENPFYTYIMGKHDWLPNGNMLITESANGRIFEITDKGEIVWEYINIVYEGYIGIVEEAYRLSPDKYTKDFFQENTKKCNATNIN